MFRCARNLHDLCEVDFSRCTQVTDRLLVPLVRLIGARLRALRVALCTQLTDASVDAVTECCATPTTRYAGGTLRVVDLTRVWSVTQDAVDKLRYSIVACKVLYEPYLDKFD